MIFVPFLLRRLLIRNSFSTVSSGTCYETYVHYLLTKKYQFQLDRVGGTGDQGIDLIGKLFSISIIVQCKYYSDYLPPNFIRELQGVVTFQRQNQSYDNSNDWLGLLVCNNGLKEGGLEFLRCSNTPLGILILELEEEFFRGCIFNNPAKKLLKTLNLKTVHFLDHFGNQIKGVELNL